MRPQPPCARIRAASRQLGEWISAWRAVPCGLLPAGDELRRVEAWVAQAGAAVRELSPEERAAQDTRKEIAGYKLRLSELQSLLKEIETLARVRRTELRSSGDHLKAAAAWAKHVREIG